MSPIYNHDHHPPHRHLGEQGWTLSLMQMSATARLAGALGLIVLLWIGVLAVLQ